MIAKTKLAGIVLLGIITSAGAQQKNPGYYQRKFSTYLNFRGSLSAAVQIDRDGVKIMGGGQVRGRGGLTIYWEEAEAFVQLTKTLAPDSMEALINRKASVRWDKKFLEDAMKRIAQKENTRSFSLSGKRIVLDPGHIAGNMDMARIEQKFLHFTKKNHEGLAVDSLDIVEGMLTWQTASILKKMLEEQGAEVFMSRGDNETCFGITYTQWVKTRKKTVLDSLKKNGEISLQKYSQLVQAGEQKLFWEFFRDYELMNRAKKINAFHPDISVIIHYNVDEKNTDWLKPSEKNFNMAFIPGGMTADVFKNTKGKINFLRLLLSNELEASEKLSALTVQQFHKQLQVPIARQEDALYLKDNCLATPSAGVFCRNLALCRTVNSVLVYGECLFQDNEKECLQLIKKDKTYYGISTNERVYSVARCYFDALMQFVQGIK